MKVVVQIALICTLVTLSSTLKCQVCEGGPSPGVCQDPDDKGISKECQSWETACFFTKTGTLRNFSYMYFYKIDDAIFPFF